MPRRDAAKLDGLVCHVMNRAARRARIFDSPGDFDALQRLLAEARNRVPLRILAFCGMPNHWHLVVWPRQGQELVKFMHWFTLTHAMRWHRQRGTAGTGHVYQGPYRVFPVQTDGSLLRVYRYVERNALRARLVERAEEWRWGSLWHRERGNRDGLLTEGPTSLPPEWTKVVNEPQSDAELKALRLAVRRGSPYGSDDWTIATAAHLGLEHTLRPRGRPPRRPLAPPGDDTTEP